MAVGIICEYNPFHNGHLYHLNKAKELYPNEPIILVMSSHFLQRGEMSILNKWEKTEIALHYGIDIVAELPFVFSSQSADVFAKGAIEILNSLGVKYLVFGSETNDIELLKNIATTQINNVLFDSKVTKSLDIGLSYPEAISNAINSTLNVKINKPNDILGISYIKEIIKQKANIIPISIKRTNDYHDKELNSDIVSATSIRTALDKGIDIEQYVPSYTYKYINNNHKLENFYNLLKYKILSELNNLAIYQTVDEGIEGRIKKYINSSKTLEELIQNIKTKRYTYNKIKRMLVHILCSFTKEEAKRNKNSDYVRILGFSKKGKQHLKEVKKEAALPIITKFKDTTSEILDIEFRVSSIYYYNDSDSIDLEYKQKPIIKDQN